MNAWKWPSMKFKFKNLEWYICNMQRELWSSVANDIYYVLCLKLGAKCPIRLLQFTNECSLHVQIGVNAKVCMLGWAEIFLLFQAAFICVLHFYSLYTFILVLMPSQISKNPFYHTKHQIISYNDILNCLTDTVPQCKISASKWHFN